MFSVFAVHRVPERGDSGSGGSLPVHDYADDRGEDAQGHLQRGVRSAALPHSPHSHSGLLLVHRHSTHCQGQAARVTVQRFL